MPRPASYRELLRTPPDEQHPNGSTTWWTRSQAMVIGYTSAIAGDELTLCDIDGEYGVIVLDGAQVSIEHAAGSASVAEAAVAFVPPGDSTLRVTADGTIVRLLAADTAPGPSAACANAGDYAMPDDNVSPFVAWPSPPDGDRVRVYPISEHPIEPGRLGRIFRCSTVMINVLPDDDRPQRPDAALAPQPRRLRAGVVAGPRRLRAPHPRPLDTRFVDLA